MTGTIAQTAVCGSPIHQLQNLGESMCTSRCEASYGKDFEYLSKLTTINDDNRIYQKLQGKTNLRCVREFLDENAHKVRNVR